MGSITTWARLEPHSRAADMEAGLEMRVHDPLWMLARQWQFGEFQGEDTGSPVWTTANAVENPISRYLPGPLDGHVSDDVQDYSVAVPLECLVERERTAADVVFATNRRLAVEAGLYFLRLLGAALARNSRASLLAAHAVDVLSASERAVMDPESARFLDLMAGRALDGAKLLATARDRSTTDAAVALGFQQQDVAEAAAAIDTWLKWCRRTVGEIAPAPARSAWNPERMEYSCAIAAPNDVSDQTVLVAREYAGGHLDWFSFDAVSGASLKGNLSQRPRSFSVATLPTSLNFRGLPAGRLWEFEDAQVRFGAIEAGPTDLARLLLVEFLTQYGNDFFTIPLNVEAGVLVNIEQVTITNTFGDVTPASPGAAGNEWRIFSLSNDGAVGTPPSSALFLPPVLGQHLAGATLEQVDLVRDEMANIAWAIEQVVMSRSGAPLNRHEQYQARRQRESGDRPPSAGSATYRLDTWQSTRPEYWIPLVPEPPAPGESVTHLVCYDPEDQIQGQLLSEKGAGARLYLFDEEIPRSGSQVRRVAQYTRWYDGRTYAWIGREKQPARGQASSGLRYDAVEVAPE